MEVEYTKCFIPDIERAKEFLTIFKHREENKPIVKDNEGHVVTHQEWFSLAYRPLSMTRYEFDLYEEWHDDVDLIVGEIEITE